MKQKSILITGFILLLSAGFWPLNIQADNLLKNEKITLLSAIEQISQKYDVYFTFDMTLISEVKVEYEHKEYNTAEEAVSAILRGTDLKYKFYDRRFVILYKKGEEGLESLKKMSKHLDGLIGEEEKTIISEQKGEIKAIPRLSSRLSSRLLSKKIQRIAFTVEGKVIDQDGESLIGVNIQVKGSNKGTATDFDGNFVLEDIDENAVLVISYIGFQPQEISVNGESNLEIIMISDSQLLDEIVVVGYGSKSREEITGAISKVNTEKLAISTEPSAISRVQGRVSGVTVLSSHVPGGEANILIRGLGTINDASPLYVIDGVPVGPSNNLNPNDIESISILKDAASAAIYGTRGANGVVLITTKKGSSMQENNLNFSIRAGTNIPTKGYDLLNTQEYGELLWMTAKNQGLTPGVDWSHPHYGNGTEPRIPDYIYPEGAMEGDPGTNPINYSYDPFDESVYSAIIKANKIGTNWYDEITRNGFIQDYNLNFSGSNSSFKHYTSLSYLKENGILLNTGFERYNFFNSLEFKPSSVKWLSIGHSINASLSSPKGSLENNSEYAPIGNSFKLQPIIPVYDIEGQYAGTVPQALGESFNPVAQLNRAKTNENKRYRILGNLNGSAQIIENLQFKTLFGYDLGFSYGINRGFPRPEHYQKINPSVTKNDNLAFQWNWSNIIEFDKEIIENQKLGILLGTEAVAYRNIYSSAFRDMYFSLDPNYMQLNAGEGEQKNNGSISEWSLFSLFGRVDYSIYGKYIFEATIRRDGSSRFGALERNGIFPAGSLAWLLSEERFLQSVNWIDFLKLRFGYGITGNDRIGNYNSFSTFGPDVTYAAYDLTGTNTSTIKGFMPLEGGNPNVGWETTQTYNGGLDLIAFSNLNISIDLWTRLTNDMLFRQGIPDVNGIETAPFINIGSMRNIGVDFEIGYDNRNRNKFGYGIDFSLSHYKNEVIRLSANENEDVIMGNYRNVNYLRSETGRSFPEFYGFIVDGIFQSESEVEAHPRAFGSNGNYNSVGRFKYRDLNGDGVIDDDDMTYIGSPHPILTGGINLDLSFQRFNVNMFFFGSYGNKSINLARRNIDFGMFDGNYRKIVLYDSWGSPYLEDNSKASLPIHDLNEGSTQPSSFFIEDGSYLRFKNLRVSYLIPEEAFKRFNIKNVSIYFQVNNLFTLTKYTGLDPEFYNSIDRYGLDFGSWPMPKQLNFGLDINF